MWRGLLLLTGATLACGPALAADIAATRVPVYGKASAPAHRGEVAEDSDLLFTPSAAFPVVTIPPHTPILLGKSTLPGYYGSTHSYDYQGPYYGGPNINYRFQLPYACGVLGYC
jgi:hypothetical protein